MTSPSDIPHPVKENLAFVFVPGSFCPADFYDEVARHLVSSGFADVTTSPLLSAVPKHAQRTPPATLSDDASTVRETIRSCLARGKDVVLVMHSYGGFAGTEALAGLPSRSTLSDTKSTSQGVVVGVLYISAFLPLSGDSVRTLFDPYLMDNLRFGNPGGYMEMGEEAGPGIFSDLYAEGRLDEVKLWSSRLITQSSDSFDGVITHDPWKQESFQGKAVYLTGMLDPIVQLEFARKMVERVSEVAGEQRVDIVEIENGGHSMMVSKPDVVVNVIERLVSSLVKAK